MSFLQSQDISVIIARQTEIVKQIFGGMSRSGLLAKPSQTQQLRIEQSTLEALLKQEEIPIIETQPTTQNNNLRNALIIGEILLLI